MSALEKGTRVRCWPGSVNGRSYLAEVISEGIVEFGGTRCYRVRADDGHSDYIAATHVRSLTDYELGQRVQFSTHPRSSKWEKKWMPQLTYKGELGGGGEGIIIGKRTLANGENRYNGYDEPITFIPKERITAWLVAFDMRRKPVPVLPEHVTAIEDQQ